MKTKVLSIFLTLFLASIFALSNAFAQDASQGHLPEDAIARLGNGIIHQIVYTPDGSQIAVASSVGVWIYDVDTGAEVALLGGGSVTCIAYSPNGNTIATGGDDYNEEVRLWNVNADTGSPKGTLDTGGFVNSVAYSPDGNTLAIAGTDVQLWNAHTGTLEKTFRGHAGVVWQVAYSPDGSTLASASEDGTVLLWGLTPSPVTVIPNISEVGVKADVNGDGIVNIQDLVLVSANFGIRGQHPADVNGDGVVNIQDLVAVAAALGEAAASAPSAATLSPEIIKQWLAAAAQRNLTDATSLQGIRVLEALLSALTPKETALLPNYPNPFNPETWIPYQLAKPAEVSIAIHTADGILVRTLGLGHHGVGIYKSRSRAAYWDGKNEVGEPVASGVYFYMLTAGEFTATRKMLIRK